MTVIKEAYRYVDPSVISWILMAIIGIACSVSDFRTSLWRGAVIGLISMFCVAISVLIFCVPATRMEVLADENFWIEDVVDAGWEIIEQDGREITLQRYDDYGDWE